MRKIEKIVIHTTATPQTTTVESIRRYWRDVLKWKQVGYHVIVLASGGIVRLAGDDVITNGVAGHNSTALHVSYIGGIDAEGKPKDTRTEAQKEAIEKQVKAWLELYPNAVVCGHNQLGLKACPSFDVRPWLKEIGIPVKNIAQGKLLVKI